MLGIGQRFLSKCISRKLEKTLDIKHINRPKFVSTSIKTSEMRTEKKTFLLIVGLIICSLNFILNSTNNIQLLHFHSHFVHKQMFNIDDKILRQITNQGMKDLHIHIKCDKV